MVFESYIPPSYLKILEDINAYITKELGGSIELLEYKDLNIIKIKWYKFINEHNDTIYFERLFSYQEFESMNYPILIAQKFVDECKERLKKDGYSIIPI